ncbi:hypothetical protein NLM59_06035 [Weeksellaceae bacterium KMM 9724]|uniref:hypothetical protein n=1 Tax=Profundicola chukchiensis TaxID=2961959 RepID=UPI00243AAEAD|nr:hypothetical protein [Profundicola chukchiensis]MDG4950475.1 hypothetical protein [Profundicola chukchiensis]
MRIYLYLLLLLSSNFVLGQFPDIDPTWDNYYNNNPSGISKNYSGEEIVRIIHKVGFEPKTQELKHQNLEKILMLFTDETTLRQFSIDGDYYSRTYKHDKWFELYNSIYKRVDKKTWDRYCPYLIPLMKIDGLPIY